MFYLLVELNSYRQLRKLNGPLVDDLEQRARTILADCGASPLADDNGLHYFRFDAVRAGEHEHILDTALRVRDYLGQHAGSLAGFAIYLNVAEEPSPEAAVRELRAMALRTAIEEAVVVSESAAIAVEPYAKLEKRSGYFIVGEKHERPSVSAISYREFLRRDDVVSSILEVCDQFLEPQAGGAVLVHGPPDCGKGIAAYFAARTLYGSNEAGWPFEIGPMGAVPYAPLVCTLTSSRIATLESNMAAADRALWKRHGSAIESIRSPQRQGEFVDSPDSDMGIAFRCLVFAYMRAMMTRNLPPFIICYAVHEYDPTSLSLLQAVFRDLERGPTIVLLTSEKPFLPMALRDVSHRKLEIAAPTIEEWRRLAARVTGPAMGSACILSTVRGGHPVFHTLVAERAFSRDQLQNRLPPGTRLLGALEDEYIETMLAIALADGALSIDLLSAFMAELGVAPVRTPELINDLQRLGYLRDTILLSTASPGLADSLAAAFPATTRRVTTALEHFLRAEEVEISTPIYTFLLEAGDAHRSLHTIKRYIESLLERRRHKEARALLYGSLPTFPGSSDVQARSTLHLLLYVNRLRLALQSRDEATADRVFPGWRNLTIYSPKSSLHGDYLLTKAQYLNAKGSRDEGLLLVKKAILSYQDAEAPQGVARANAEFGVVMLNQGSISSARDYFSIASRTAAQVADRRDALHAGILELGTDVTIGSLTRAREQAEILKADAARLAVRQEELYLDFVLGRLAFELGRYAEAEDIFSRGLCEADVINNEEAGSLLTRWLSRSVAYRGAARRGLEILDTTSSSREAVLFRTEILIFLGQFGDAAETAAGAADSEPRAYFRPAHALAWDSGFANMEDRSMDPRDGVITHLLSAFGAYAQAEHGDHTAAIEVLHRLTRAGSPAIQDPYASLYLLLYSEILPENGGDEIEDMVTILGKAVKHLRERTSRIDNYADKTSYLRKGYWNACLSEKAKRYNLV